LLFVLAFFFYIDGVYTIIDMATAYGQALGLDSTGLLLALLVTQIVAFPFALLYGRLAQRFKTENIITVCILGYIAIAVYAIFLRTQFQFWVLEGNVRQLWPARVNFVYDLLTVMMRGSCFCR
jgi:UMF1 family MFS transporter